MDIKDFIYGATDSYSLNNIHNFSLNIHKLENDRILFDIYERLMTMNKPNDNAYLKQLLVNTLVSNDVIEPSRAIAIDAILKDIENEK